MTAGPAGPPPPPSDRSKRAWRVWARDRRSAAPPDHAAYCRVLQEFLGAIRPAGWIVTYECLEGEVDLSSLRRDSDLGSFALTRTPAGGGPLTLHPADSELERHRYGFAQPVATAPTVADTAVSVVLVPGLAFDRQGARLGWGEGHYDRFLSRLASSVLRVGVTGGSVVDRLPVDPHDVAMTHLATDVAVVGVERR